MTRKTVFVSGCFDLLHGGHVQFLLSARALGDRLVVCLPGDEVVARYKGRLPALPVDQKVCIFRSLRMVDEVCVGEDREPGLNFKTHFLRVRPALLVAATDDAFAGAKRRLCKEVGARYVQVSKSKDWPDFSTTALVRRMRAPREAPLRVDFAGGWLDVPRLAVDGGAIVNCTIQPPTSLTASPYHRIGAGLGGSAAHSLLSGDDAVATELAMGVGWQDPAVIAETGLCVWRSGPRPVLQMKVHPDSMLAGRMALWWTGRRHDTPKAADKRRDYRRICRAGRIASSAVARRDFDGLCHAVRLSYDVQRAEGSDALGELGQRAKKYCGGGWGGYALYLFDDRAARDRCVRAVDGAMAIEPFMRFGGEELP